MKLLLAAGADPTLTTGYWSDIYPTPMELAKSSLDSSRDELPKNKMKNIENMLTTCLDFWNTSDHATAHAGGRRKWDNKCFDLVTMNEALELTVAICDWTAEKPKENEQPMNPSQICAFAIGQQALQKVQVLERQKQQKAATEAWKEANKVYCRCYNRGAAQCITKSCVRCCHDSKCHRHKNI